jgi:hypothetical protein
VGAFFISYRRGDSEGQARALSIQLAEIIGKDSVFMDVDSIALGSDFRAVLHERLASCDLMLALIGPGWLDAKDASGSRRLESPTDYVRQEIEAALKRNIPVTPVLLQGATMPAPERLPEDIRDLVYRNSFELSHSRWESDVNEMFKRLGLRRAENVANAPVPAATSRRKYMIAAGGLVVLALVAGMWMLSSQSLTRERTGIVRSKAPAAADTCAQGHVWREATPADRVCVAPETRSQTAEENRLASTRRNPSGGPYGPDTCLQGFVWREAFDGDRVCVTPESRARAAKDNRLASSRRAS